LRYIATLENGNAQVSLQAVDSNHPFYNLSGSDNIISFTTDRYQNRPLVIKGPGAGAEVTAAGMFADIIRILN
jgi:aspartokinase/homoserine dehydrogenase 1